MISILPFSLGAQLPMVTARQTLGEFGELQVVRDCGCPSCKRTRTLVRLPTNFKCADVICDFCGYLAQVKTLTKEDVSSIPYSVLGAAWRPQEERMKAGKYFPMYLVLTPKDRHHYAIYYLSADLQRPKMFEPRKPLSAKAQKKGWQGFRYRFEECDRASFVRLV